MASLRVLGHVHMAPPSNNAGSELMLHTLCRGLIDRGHEARILVEGSDTGGDRTHQGVEILSTVGMRRDPRHDLRHQMHSWANVVVTHLDCTLPAVSHARDHHSPIVHLVHNHLQLAANHITPKACDLAVFNSEWLAGHHLAAGWDGPNIVVHPPIVADDYRCTPGDAVGIVNLTASKGVEVFYELARRNPGRPFVGLVGAYGWQLDANNVGYDPKQGDPSLAMQAAAPSNVTIVPHTAHMADNFYSRIGVLLMPSDYESWGLVAREATTSGIPVIAHPTLGLVEQLGDAGIFCDRDNIDEWDGALRTLSAAAGKRAAKRAQQWDDKAPAELDLFTGALEALC